MRDMLPHQSAGSHSKPEPAAPIEPEGMEAAWERVLDCGAPGPGREAPRLFYQAGAFDHESQPPYGGEEFENV